MRKPAPVDHPIHEPLRERWSPRAFDARDVDPTILASLFEAARWAPSSGNEQPWSFVVGTRDRPDLHEALAGVLTEANRRWAPRAPVLLLSVARLHRRSGKPNRHAWHDTGLATGNLLIEATARGLAVHPMAGFDAEAARERFAIPAGHDPVAMIALGWPGDPDTLPEDLKQRELAPRQREPVAKFVFSGAWGTPLFVGAPPEVPQARAGAGRGDLP